MNKTQAFKEKCFQQFTAFEQGLNGEHSSDLHQLRRTQANSLATIAFPTVKDEEWKYTDVSSLLEKDFTVSTSDYQVNADELKQFTFENFDAYTLVFVNGVYKQALSNCEGLAAKAIVLPLEDALKTYSDIILEKCQLAAQNNRSFFSALNTSFLKSGVFVHVPKNMQLDKPVYLLYVNTEANIASHPRNIIIAETGAQVSVIENYSSLTETAYFNNVFTSIFAGENAIVEHIKIQDESSEAYHVATTEVYESRYARYTSYNVQFGGKIARNNIDTHFADENGEAHLFGLYIGGSGQLIDNHTLIDHAKPNCHSNELYKGVLSGNARGVFNGKVLVQKDAQKTLAFQANKNILLSDEAIIDTKPQLEIFADDVKCSHGATIGQLDETALFYLRSRGFSNELARSILIFAFADDTVKNIPFEGIVSYLEKRINKKLNSNF